MCNKTPNKSHCGRDSIIQVKKDLILIMVHWEEQRNVDGTVVLYMKQFLSIIVGCAMVHMIVLGEPPELSEGTHSSRRGT